MPNTQRVDAPETQPEQNDGSLANRPTHTIRSGPIKVDSWKQSGRHGEFETASITRSWKDDSGQWHDQKITNLSADELLSLSRNAARMRDAIVDKQQSRGKSR